MSQTIFQQETELSGGVLARLFAEFSGPAADASVKNQLAKRVIQEALLQETLNHVRRHSPFFQEHYREVPEAISLETLSLLPPTNRNDMADNHDRVLADNQTFAFASHTTGTTTGAYLSVYRSREEHSFISDFFSTMIDLCRTTQQESENCPEPLTPLILSFPIQHHGATIPIPTDAKVFVGGVADNHLLADSVRMLTTEYAIPGHERHISTLSGPLYQLLCFTSYLHEQGYDFTSSSIRQLFSYGQLVSPRDREFLESSWQAPLLDRYSMTEAFGGAAYCRACDGYHFEDFILPELVHPETLAPVTTADNDCLGVLLITVLYPFVQMQPVMRYNTGDVFQTVPCPARAEGYGYQYKGRSRNCLFDFRTPEAPVLLFSSAECYKVLDSVADITRAEWFSNLTLLKDKTPGSMMKYRVTQSESHEGRLCVEVAIELRYAPHLYPDQAKAVRQSLQERLLAVHPELAQRIEAGRAELVVHCSGPQTILPPYPQKV